MLWRQHHYLRLFCNSKWKIVAYSALFMFCFHPPKETVEESRTTNKIKHRNKKKLRALRERFHGVVGQFVSWEFSLFVSFSNWCRLCWFFCGSLLWKNVSTWFHYNLYCHVKCCAIKFHDRRIGRPVTSLMNCKWFFTSMAFSAV